MIGKIFVKDFFIQVKVGHLIHERQVAQPILINIAAWADISKSVTSENLDDTIDYCVIRKEIFDLVEKTEFVLIETLASNILDLVMKDERVTKGSIKLEKPNKFPDCASVGIEIEKER